MINILDLTYLDIGQSFSECRSLNSGCQGGWWMPREINWRATCDQIEANLTTCWEWVQVPDKAVYMASQELYYFWPFLLGLISLWRQILFHVLERPRQICENHLCFLCVRKVTEINSRLLWWMGQAGLMEQSLLSMASKDSKPTYTWILAWLYQLLQSQQPRFQTSLEVHQ